LVYLFYLKQFKVTSNIFCYNIYTDLKTAIY
jgi:hypothetical protein